MLCSLLGGVLSATVTIPIDVLVATIQVHFMIIELNKQKGGNIYKRNIL